MKRIFLGGRTDPTSGSRPMNSIYGGGGGGVKKKANHGSNESYDININVNGESSSVDSTYASDTSSSYGGGGGGGGGGSNINNNSNRHDPRAFKDETRFIEVWDYVGGTSFRGFIADKELPGGNIEQTLFLFFRHVAGTQLKHGLMALIELATECFACDRLVICLERNGEGLHGLVRDLGWVGFELVTLAHWMQTEIPRFNGLPSARCGSFSSVSTTSSVFSDDEITSEKWLFMGMEL